MSVFLVSQGCSDLGLRAGAIVFRNVRIGRSSSELRMQIDEEARLIQCHFERPADIRALPELVKLHQILRGINVRPRSHLPSTQKLLEYALKRGTLPTVNNLVDTYNLTSLRTKCSLGAHDLDRLTLPVELRLFHGDERFRALGSDEETTANRGEFGYTDAQRRVICRLDSQQADFSKVTFDTTNVLLIVESSTVHGAEQLERIFAKIATNVVQNCEGQSKIVALPT